MAQSPRENRNEPRSGWRNDEDRGHRDDGRRRFGTERDDERERFERFERFGPASGQEWSESRRGGAEPHERARGDPWQAGGQGSPQVSPQVSPQYSPQYSPSYGPPAYGSGGPFGVVSGAFPPGPWWGPPTGPSGGWYPTSALGGPGFGRVGFGGGLDDEGMPPGRDRPGHGTRQYGHRGRGPKGYTRSDERIREDVCDVLTDHPMVDASDVEVAVHSGEVTLSGSVSSREEKRLAEDIIENLSGVKDVSNQLRVHRWPRREVPAGDDRPEE